jgi:hypothetical protein
VPYDAPRYYFVTPVSNKLKVVSSEKKEKSDGDMLIMKQQKNRPDANGQLVSLHDGRFPHARRCIGIAKPQTLATCDVGMAYSHRTVNTLQSLER